jgi:hypothetical protein
MEQSSTPGRVVKGVSGHELDVTLVFASPLSREAATQTLRSWPLDAELYGQGDEIRSVRLTGETDPDTLQALLQAGLDGGLLRSAEVGRRGFLRSATGQTDWMPWRRNVVVGRDLARLALEDGLHYLIE